MARPDCDDGWIKLANELGAALASADLSAGERVVLWFAIERFFGPQKPRAVEVRGKAVSRATGMSVSGARRAIRSLVSIGILEPIGAPESKQFRLVKDYDRWSDPSRGPLFPFGRGFALAVRDRINGGCSPRETRGVSPRETRGVSPGEHPGGSLQGSTPRGSPGERPHPIKKT